MSFKMFKVRILIAVEQWLPNCGTRTISGTRRPSRWYARPFSSSTQKKTFCFYLPGSVNKFLHFCVLSLFVSKNDVYYFSQPFCSCCICVKSGLPNFSSNNIGQNEFSWNKVFSRWYVVKKQDPQMVRDQKKFGNHCRRVINISSLIQLESDHFFIPRYWKN